MIIAPESGSPGPGMYIDEKENVAEKVHKTNLTVNRKCEILILPRMSSLLMNKRLSFKERNETAIL